MPVNTVFDDAVTPRPEKNLDGKKRIFNFQLFGVLKV
jgi:hypothetical protein